MAMSAGVSANASVMEILLENIPGAIDATAANTRHDRQGTDWWVEVVGNEDRRRVSVDVKVRAEDFARHGKDDLALETWSVLNESPGWTRDPRKRTDYILWVWMDTGRWCLVPFLMLCCVFTDKWQEWRGAYQRAVQKTLPRGPGENGWHSECVFVPRKVVWRSIYQRYGGELLS